VEAAVACGADGVQLTEGNHHRVAAARVALRRGVVGSAADGGGSGDDDGPPEAGPSGSATTTTAAVACGTAEPLVGCSVHSVEAALGAVSFGADFLQVG
jgi:hypothetical protein